MSRAPYNDTELNELRAAAVYGASIAGEESVEEITRLLATIDQLKSERGDNAMMKALVANHEGIINLMNTARVWQCGCDPDVGYQCEECATRDLFRDLSGIAKIVADSAGTAMGAGGEG